MSTTTEQDYNIEKNQYVMFDALTIKQHIKDRLNQGKVFTDQNYEGSNISTLVDIISYTFNALMYYLNRTSTEAMFSDAQIYENMNRIVKLLDYKPIGNQTSMISFEATAASTLAAGTYLIPRYSYINANGIMFCLNEDVVTNKSTSDAELLTDLSNKTLLYQGFFKEYPLQTAAGEANEIIYLLPGDNITIDHFNIHVYVKESDGVWHEWKRANSLYLENYDARVFEVRYNENKHYELKFGNGINGKILNVDETVAIYYLESDGKLGEVGVGALDGMSLLKYSTSQFAGTDGILEQVILTDTDEPISDSDLSKITFTNTMNSTYFNEDESVDSIRTNAPGNFRSQYRVTTEADYETYLKTNFSQIIHDVKVVNNWTYVSEYLKYFYDLGISNPNLESRTLYNQVMFGDSCNFNNTFAFIVPKTVQDRINFAYLTPSQKELIMYQMKSVKVLTSEFLPMDPVYMSVALMIPAEGLTYSVADAEKTKLVVYLTEKNRRSTNSVKLEVIQVLKDYFSRSNVFLGQVLDVNAITKDILDIAGVKTFKTERTDGNAAKYEGLSLGIWNPVYPSDIRIVTNNLALPFYKIPFYSDLEGLSDIVEVRLDNQIYESVEF